MRGGEGRSACVAIAEKRMLDFVGNGMDDVGFSCYDWDVRLRPRVDDGWVMECFFHTIDADDVVFYEPGWLNRSQYGAF